MTTRAGAGWSGTFSSAFGRKTFLSLFLPYRSASVLLRAPDLPFFGASERLGNICNIF